VLPVNEKLVKDDETFLDIFDQNLSKNKEIKEDH
jgi:hypothetical protein